MSRRKWTREKIIETINDLHGNGHSLSTRRMAELGYSGMVTTAYKSEFFGSWRDAIRAAGLDPKEVCKRKRKWTRERILREIQRLHREDEDLSHSAAKRNHQYLVVVAVDDRMFGSWRNAIEAAGLDYEGISKHRFWSKERIIENIQQLHGNGDDLSHEAAKNNHGALVSAASSKRYFGSWRAAIEAADIEYADIRKINRWTREKIIQTIRDLHTQGESVNNSNMRRMGYRGMMEAASREANFGSWAAAVGAAGLDYDAIRKS
jgi:tRNA A37 N6-isopentenylltransferase MiaA